MIPFYQSYPDWIRYHGIAIQDGTLWQVIGNDSKSHEEYRPGLVRHDLETGRVLVEAIDGAVEPAAPESAQCQVDTGRQRQVLSLWRVGASTYIDRGWREDA